MLINELVKEAHANAVNKGFWEEEKSFGEQVVLMHSELSEAIEEFRNGKGIAEIYTKCKMEEIKNVGQGGCGVCKNCALNKPEGIPVELADTVIRIFDTCGRYGIDLEQAIATKMKYNEGRPHKHGKVI